jgi:hypothetical protein
LISVDTGEVIRCDSRSKIDKLALWMMAAFGPICRIARVEIREVTKP